MHEAVVVLRRGTGTPETHPPTQPTPPHPCTHTSKRSLIGLLRTKFLAPTRCVTPPFSMAVPGRGAGVLLMLVVRGVALVVVWVGGWVGWLPC